MTAADSTEPPIERPAGTGPVEPSEHATGPIRVLGVGRPDRPAVGWTEILVAAALYVSLQVVLIGAALILNGGRAPASPWLVAISAVCAFGAVAVAVAVRVRSWAALGLRRVRIRTALLGVAAGLGIWVVSRALIIGYVSITGDRTDPQADLAVFGGPVSTVLVVAIGGLIVPLGEELLFRGIGYAGLRRYGSVLAAIGSGLVFALAHGLNVVFAAALVLGLVNALIYERTRSVWPCATAHATFNLLSFALALAIR